MHKCSLYDDNDNDDSDNALNSENLLIRIENFFSNNNSNNLQMSAVNLFLVLPNQ